MNTYVIYKCIFMIATVYRFGHYEDKGYWFSFAVTQRLLRFYHKENETGLGGEHLYEYQINIENPYGANDYTEFDAPNGYAEMLYYRLFPLARFPDTDNISKYQSKLANQLLSEGYDSVVFGFKPVSSPTDEKRQEWINRQYFGNLPLGKRNTKYIYLWLLKNIDTYRYYAREIPIPEFEE